MNLSKLHQLRIAEHRVDVPQLLPESFYDTVQADLDALREQVADVPDSSETEHQLEAYETELSLLYGLRVRKTLRAAGLAAGGHSIKLDGLTPREEEFFEEIMASIEVEHDRLFGDITDLDP